jgi:hypothetical protein
MKTIPRLDDPVTESFDDGGAGDNDFSVFVDRPPGVIPEGTIHVADVYREWWAAQKPKPRERKTFTAGGKTYRERNTEPVRGWPVHSSRITPNLGVIQAAAPKAARCAYTYLGSDTEASTRARDCASVIRQATKAQAPEPVIDRDAEPPKPKHPDPLPEVNRQRDELQALWDEYLEQITPPSFREMMATEGTRCVMEKPDGTKLMVSVR